MNIEEILEYFNNFKNRNIITEYYLIDNVYGIIEKNNNLYNEIKDNLFEGWVQFFTEDETCFDISYPEFINLKSISITRKIILDNFGEVNQSTSLDPLKELFQYLMK